MNRRLAAAAGRVGQGPVADFVDAAQAAPMTAGPPDSGAARTRGATNRSATGGDSTMAESVYKIIELVGTSTESWEKAALAAVARAGKTLRDIRIAEIADLDMHMQDGKVQAYRAKVKLSFKYEDED